MRTVGPEPLDDDFTVDRFIERLMTRNNSPVKAVLLDQKVLAGVGNIYADESLWGAKIHPAVTVAKIPRTKLVVLHQSLRDILKQSIENGGSTDKNYVNAEGKKGSYLNFANVFRKEGRPCPRCGTEIIKIRVAGRGTHICPKEQKAPR
jgi:formamidopyrimidine-DNA glycosylase